MTLAEIKDAVLSGKKVCWVNDLYDVVCDDGRNFFIVCNQNQYTTGLTWQDEITMNGRSEQFYIKDLLP